jgi:single-strand DNA-binding protein
MLNRVILMGRLVADPELKTTASGVSVTSFRIAVDRNYVKSGEERKADFIDIVCWRQTAEFVCRYFGKGSLIAVEGQLQSRTYQAKDGTNRYVVEVVADNVSFTGERRDGSSSYGAAYNQAYSQGYAQPAAPAAPQAPVQPVPSYQSGSNSDFQELVDDDDLPF